MDLGLKGRTVVVTGASAGIGQATSLALAAEGCRLAAGARNGERLEALAADVRDQGGEVVTVTGDLTEQARVQHLVDAARDTFGGVDALVTCVGSTPVGDFDDLTDDVWQQAFTMKFLATVRAVRAALPALRAADGGRVVVVGGNTAQEPTPWMATSGAMNAALGNLVATLARQYGPDGVGAVCVNPGPVRTARYDGMHGTVMRRESLDAEAAARHIVAAIPDGRIAEPAEIGALIAWLASPRAAHLTGTTVVADGGQSWAR